MGLTRNHQCDTLFNQKWLRMARHSRRISTLDNGLSVLLQMKEKYDILVEIPKIPIAQKGKVEIHEKRWIVERTIAWTNNNRRCSKDYERKTENANAYLIIANIRRLAKKLT